MTVDSVAPPTELSNAARALAKDFLHSVVVVDDLADFGDSDLLRSTGSDEVARVDPVDDWPETGDADGTSTPLRRRIPGLRAPHRLPDDEILEQALNAKVLVDGFAEQGLVCAIMRPGPNESPVDLTVLAASRADIVVLDWELNGDDGQAALAIVHRLVHEETQVKPGGRLRLIAFYSGAIAIREIARRLQNALHRERPDPLFEMDGEFTLTAGAVRIVVFAKGTKLLDDADDALRSRLVAVNELPARLVSEFAAMAPGLVQHVAMASLAALRKNMHRLLGRLSANLDPGYLWHRATQARPADAEEHLVELVVGEVRSILADASVGSRANIDAIAGWIQRDVRTDFASSFGETTARSADDVLALLTEGAVGRSDACRDVRSRFRKMSADKKPHRNEEIAGFAETPEEARRSNEGFAVLMSLRTRYDHPPPRLELGTILERGRGRCRTWWLCVQPRCDSVRMKESRAFPLLPLYPSAGNDWFDFLVPNGSDGYSRFRLGRKPADIDKQLFAVHPRESDAVTAELQGKTFFFKSSRYRYAWLADLRPEHAQRIAQQLANEFARVGLSESEWLRLWATH